MKYLKTYEELNTNQTDIINEIEYEFIQSFKSEKDLEDFCLSETGLDDIDDFDFKLLPDMLIGHLQFYDIDYNTVRNLISNIISNVDLDNCDELRNLSYDDFLVKKQAEKYNL